MTAALASLVDKIDLPSQPGVSVRTCRAVLRTLARLAGPDGEFKWGCRVSKLAKLCEVSESTIKRAERFLVELGVLERAAVGGGRASTRWRIVLERLGAVPETPRLRPTTPPSAAPQPAHHEPAQEHKPSFVPQIPQRRGPSGMSPPVVETCTHGGDASTLPDGSPRCAICRRQRTTQNNDAPPAPPRQARPNSISGCRQSETG